MKTDVTRMTRTIHALLLLAVVGCGTRPQRAATNDTAKAGADAQGAPSPAVPVPSAGAAALSADSMRALADQSRIRGSAAAPIWIVEVSDFQCPYCRQWHEQTYATVIRDYVDRSLVRLAYLNLPIQSHQHAWIAAEAAMCAGVQGKFWQYHDALFRTQEQWSALPAAEATFDSLARAVGVNGAAWRDCLTSQAIRSLIVQDVRRVEQTGVRSTPTFFIGDTAVVGALPTAVFRAVIDGQLKKAGAATPPGR